METAKLQNWLEVYFGYGVDVPNRRVFLSDDVSDASISDIVKGLYLMETMSNEEPIEVFISSFGGDTYEMFALYDIFMTLAAPVHTFAYGKCMSAAPLLLAAGEKGQRWCSPHCWFMLHDMSVETHGTQSQIREESKHSDKMLETWFKLLAKHSSEGKDARFWKTKCSKAHDVYFSAEEAIEWGIADKIWSEK